MPGKGRKIYKQVGLCYLIVVGTYFFDQVSKFCADKFILQGSSIPLVKNIIHLTLAYNTGAAFGILKDHAYVFIIIASLAIILINYFILYKTKMLSFLERIALSLILGGTLGNLTDRLRFSYVVDFIDFRVWPIFNAADSAITIGAVLIAISLLLKTKSEAKENA